MELSNHSHNSVLNLTSRSLSLQLCALSKKPRYPLLCLLSFWFSRFWFSRFSVKISSSYLSPQGSLKRGNTVAMVPASWGSLLEGKEERKQGRIHGDKSLLEVEGRKAKACQTDRRTNGLTHPLIKSLRRDWKVGSGPVMINDILILQNFWT